MTEAGGGGLDTEWIPGQHCSPGQEGESQALLPGQSSGWGLVSGQTGLAYRLANTQATGTQATASLATRVTLASCGQTFMSWIQRNILCII